MITEDKASWTEVTTNMSLIDVINLNDALNLTYEYRNKLQEWKQKSSK